MQYHNEKASILALVDKDTGEVQNVFLESEGDAEVKKKAFEYGLLAVRLKITLSGAELLPPHGAQDMKPTELEAVPPQPSGGRDPRW